MKWKTLRAVVEVKVMSAATEKDLCWAVDSALRAENFPLGRVPGRFGRVECKQFSRVVTALKLKEN